MIACKAVTITCLRIRDYLILFQFFGFAHFLKQLGTGCIKTPQLKFRFYTANTWVSESFSCASVRRLVEG